MNHWISRMRMPVKRYGAENYLFITLLSFAISVSATRLFLELTGYPQLGGGELHIAHVLWGGLLLFIASLLPLILANRWVYLIIALGAGAGVGLFIDEVGKFITQTNDYFYPPAAPIIYAFFLLTVLLYLQLRRPPPWNARTELYQVFEMFEEILDHDLDERELVQLKSRLEIIYNHADQPELIHLAKELLDFLESDVINVHPERLGVLERITPKLSALEDRYMTRNRSRAILAGGMVALSANALYDFAQLLFVSRSSMVLEEKIANLVTSGMITGVASLNWYTARLVLEGSAGLLLVISSVFLIVGREARGITFSYFSLLLSLTTINLLVFYFEQFSTIITAIVQFCVLLGVLHYRRKYIPNDSVEIGEASVMAQG